MRTLIRDALLPLPLVRRGKVREMYAVDGGHMLMVASDRISAFDVVLDDPIPGKGAILTALSAFWFRKTANLVPNHLVPEQVLPYVAEPYAHQIAGRWLLVHRAQRINIACGICGYLAGSAWVEYRRHGTVGGELLSPGLVEAQRLDVPLFMPAITSETGHVQSISRAQLLRLVGPRLAARLEGASLCLYAAAEAHARQRGLLLADTTFEFGLLDGELVLIDELLTPDSSRYWLAGQYRPGGPQPSFDRQFLADCLQQTGWNKQPPPPPLPAAVVAETAAKYQEALRRLAGEPLEPRAQAARGRRAAQAIICTGSGPLRSRSGRPFAIPQQEAPE